MRTDLIMPEDRILFNISRMWKDEGPEDDSDSEDNSSDEARGNSQASVTVEEGDPGFVQIRGHGTCVA